MPSPAKLFTIMTWNVGGVRFLRSSKPERSRKKAQLDRELQENLVKQYQPDIVLFQEVVRYQEEEGLRDLITPPAGYHYLSSIAIDTVKQNHPRKWAPIRKAAGAGNWPAGAYLGQGSGIMWRKSIPHGSIWDAGHEDLVTSNVLQEEVVRIDTGIFTGYRDTEPRVAVVAHFVIGLKDIFVVNAHLTTIKGEREGFPAKDALGSKIRSKQIGIILNGIVSRYNEWRAEQFPNKDRERLLWILAGDLNATPDAFEIQKLTQSNFVDISRQKGNGSKRSKIDSRASILVDYIFAGPRFYAFDPDDMLPYVNTFQPDYAVTISDHYPVIARFKMPD